MDRLQLYTRPISTIQTQAKIPMMFKITIFNTSVVEAELKISKAYIKPSKAIQ